MDSILTSIKKMLNIDEDFEAFDMDIIIHINSAFNFLLQLGVGPKTGFSIVDKTATWSDFSDNMEELGMVKTYVFAKTRILFDPPSNAFVMDAINKQIKEIEWRLNVQVDPGKE